MWHCEVDIGIYVGNQLKMDHKRVVGVNAFSYIQPQHINFACVLR